MATFDVQAHEVLLTSAISDGYAPRIHLEGVDPETGTPSRTWLYFEAVPGLYAAKGGIGFGKAKHNPVEPTEAKYWVYLARSSFDDVRDAIRANDSIGVRLTERAHPGAAGTNRLVTAIDLVVKCRSEVSRDLDGSALLSTTG